MDAAWIAIGIVVLTLTLLDAFLAVLNYNEAGIFVNRIARLQWIVIRAFTRRVSRRWRPLVLRQVTGSLIVTTLLCWIVGLVLGFSFIYLGLIGYGHFQISQGVTNNFVGAFYLSVGQFSTAGADNISPGGGWVNLVPVAEALLSVVMLSFFITFLSNIYSVIQNLRSLCADFFQVGPGVGSPVEALRPFFPAGQPRGLDLHLTFLVNDFNLYCDSLRQDRAAYHFQSGEDQFSLPFGLYMTSGVVGALQWGLPTGHAATRSPGIVRLIEAFNDFRDLRYGVMRWRRPEAPTPLSRERFAQEQEAYRSHRLDRDLDPWAARFLALNDAMADLAHASIPTDDDDTYARYVGWLTFASPAQRFVADVSRDLDFQPIYRDVVAGAVAPGPATPQAGRAAGNRRQSGVAAWLRRRRMFLDPGSVRLRGALRTLATVAVAVALASSVAFMFSISSTTAGAFAGLVAMFGTPVAAGSEGAVRRAGLVGLLPVAVGVTAGVLLPHDRIWTTVGLAVAAALAVWVGRFGPLVASFGRLLFITVLFAALLAVEPAEFVAAGVAAGIGVVCSWLASLMPEQSSSSRLRDVLHAFAARASSLLDLATDSLSTGTDGALGKRLEAAVSALQGTTAHLTAILSPDDPPVGLSRHRTQKLRLRVVDVELAARGLLRALPASTDYAVTVDVRSRLAGELVGLERHVRALASREEVAPYVVRTEVPPGWPEGARRTLAAIGGLAAAFDRLHATERADEALLAAEEEPVDFVPAHGPRQTRDATETALTDRRAVQSGLSVGLALLLGGFVSTSAQYWAALPAFQSLAAADGFTWTRNLQRAVSTVVGGAAAFALALWTDHDPVVAFTVLALTVFLTSYLRAVASSWTVFWQTVLLATMYDTVSALDAEAVNVRIAETVIGAVLALVVSALVLPTRTRRRIRERMSEAVVAARTATHAAIRRLADPGATGGTGIAAAEAEMDRQMHSIDEVARPLRHGPGALQRGGVERQLISLWALLYYVRRLGSDAGPVPASQLAPARWQQLDASLRDNFDAALTVLAERLPAQVRDVQDLTFLAQDDVTTADRERLIDIQRIDEVLRTYMDDVEPGSTGTR